MPDERRGPRESGGPFCVYLGGEEREGGADNVRVTRSFV